ncbi:unnamed protein product [Amoebophrya sp. A120]|nr:unnamed protein product [Amoebophrya sp. A120]|eukprot:GSA120T00002431001.1
MAPPDQSTNPPPSCLPSDAFSHFQQREAQLLQYNEELEREKNRAISKAQEAMRDVENLDFKNYQPSFLKSKAMQPLIDATSGDYHLTDPALSHARNAEAEPAPVPLQTVKEPPPPAVADLQPAIATKTKLVHPMASANEVETLQNTIRFQKARIIALQEELDKGIKQLTQRDGDNNQLRADNKALTEENKRLSRQHVIAEGHQDKLKKTVALLEQKIRDFEKDLGDARKENDQLSLQSRKQEQDINSKEARVNRLLEDCERYRTSLRELRSQDQDKTKSDRKELDRLLAENRKIERQRNELVAAFKKQMKLIDILKKQRTHLEAARVLSFTEDEFVRILDLGDKLGSA